MHQHSPEKVPASVHTPSSDQCDVLDSTVSIKPVQGEGQGRGGQQPHYDGGEDVI